MLRSAILRSALFAALIAVLPACNKPKDTLAVITVTRNGAAVQGAYVKLFANPVPSGNQGVLDFSRLTKEGYTDAKGEVTFDYSEFYKQGQAGLAVLDILSEKGDLVGRGIIRVVEEQTNAETVALR